MSEIRSRRRTGSDTIDDRRTRRPSIVQRVGCSRLAVVLLHVAGLTIAFECGIEVAIARPIRVPAARPFRIGALDWEAADPLAGAVHDRQRIGDVMTRAAELRPRREHLPEAMVLRRIHLLVRHRLPEDAAEIPVQAFAVRLDRKRTWTVGCPDC